ncbi:phosphoglucosamine mutase [Nisaea sp.]|uniref:phosphoglucosamine mutase n=1 Tax=Nisaea sp. TaxID=2024842 RepID=UPI002B2743A4|nr:phosphoglucosamine mutase [Nisaea sp.]
MTRNLFGTDGIRGTANAEPMTAETALRVAMAAGRHFVHSNGRPKTGHRPLAVIGKDTRLSGYMLEPAMVAGFTSIGMDVVLLGPLPTPAVASLTRSLRADLGVMLSASHNPYQDNGIKLFGPDGFKLSDEVEHEIENRIDTLGAEDRASADRLGKVRRLEDAQGRYIEIAKNTFPKGMRLEGLKLVVDCANGAAYKVAPRVLFELGAEVIEIGVSPNGTNINAGCGATAPDAMCKAVTENGAHLGIALDGDADRLIMADEHGRIIDGDQIMGLIATSWAEAGLLRGKALVTTVMSNLGLEQYLEGIGVAMHRTKVGDRYVLEHMQSGGFNLGGEQSGHMIMSEHATTGDGLIAALQVLAVLISSEKPMSEVASVFTPLPQLLKNVRYTGAPPLEGESVKTAIREGEARLAGTGRVLIRKSGTEPLIRVMAEGADEKLVADVVNDIALEIERAAG